MTTTHWHPTWELKIKTKRRKLKPTKTHKLKAENKEKSRAREINPDRSRGLYQTSLRPFIELAIFLRPCVISARRTLPRLFAASPLDLRTRGERVSLHFWIPVHAGTARGRSIYGSSSSGHRETRCPGKLKLKIVHGSSFAWFVRASDTVNRGVEFMKADDQ